ncbi:MAG: type II toxin-antitoxin system VapC family toxin [Terracidiphilus sp.]|jgi:predicted nucleic-acid-binding protein
MKIIVDTNVLLRAVVGDDARQSRAAVRAMEQAETVVIGQHALCELAWVLDRSYGVSRADIAATIRQFRETKNVLLDGPAVDAGLAVLEAGGDFADGAIAHEGKWLGGETFVSFDKKAVSLVSGRGQKARLLA